jgi:hypothetical protein
MRRKETRKADKIILQMVQNFCCFAALDVFFIPALSWAAPSLAYCSILSNVSPWPKVHVLKYCLKLYREQRYRWHCTENVLRQLCPRCLQSPLFFRKARFLLPSILERGNGRFVLHLSASVHFHNERMHFQNLFGTSSEV